MPFEELQANRLRWIEALESGKYKQGIGALRRPQGDDDCFCCLGVAADLVAPESWVLSTKGTYYSHENNTSTLHFKFHADLGLTLYVSDMLINMNDDGGKTFAEIAEYLRDIWELPK